MIESGRYFRMTCSQHSPALGRPGQNLEKLQLLSFMLKLQS